MRYTEMTLEQRRALLDDPESYPLRVVFLGKAAILTAEELEFLRRNGVDFDVDERQAEDILTKAAREDVAVLWSGPTPAVAAETGATPPATPGFVVRVVGVVAVLYAGLRLAGRLFRR